MDLILCVCFWVGIVLAPVFLDNAHNLNAHLRRLMPGPEEDE